MSVCVTTILRIKFVLQFIRNDLLWLQMGVIWKKRQVQRFHLRFNIIRGVFKNHLAKSCPTGSFLINLLYLLQLILSSLLVRMMHLIRLVNFMWNMINYYLLIWRLHSLIILWGILEKRVLFLLGINETLVLQIIRFVRKLRLKLRLLTE